MGYMTEEFKKKLAGRYFVWVGQNATTGTPNKVTGYYSKYGTFYSFPNKEDRDEFYDDYYDFNGNKHAVKGGIRKMREYALGQTMESFLEDLWYAETPVKEDGRWV